MFDIILTTINAKYQHTSLGLKYLYANLNDLQTKAKILEFSIKNGPIEIFEKIIKESPKIVGISVYIWNAREVLDLIRLFKQLRPEIKIITGGPEISHSYQENPIYKFADYLIRGEADLAFYQLCKDILEQRDIPNKCITPAPAKLSEIKSPYQYYTEEDIKHRILSVEASRGCPYKCKFCMSSLDKKVRTFDLKTLFNDLTILINRGAKEFKFIDRTFNLNIENTITILNFFLKYIDKNIFVHFEVVPDNFPAPLKDIIKKFPVGTVQFEVGIQTLNSQTLKIINRKQDIRTVIDNLIFLINETKIHLHTDLIFGLPGESIEMIEKSFNALLALKPQEIQVGILKSLKGAPLEKDNLQYQMVYNTNPPYEILQTSLISFEKMRNLHHFASFWNLYYNSGNFKKTITILLDSKGPFEQFLLFSKWVFDQAQRTHSISLDNLSKYLLEYLVNKKNIEKERAKDLIKSDYLQIAGRKLPLFLKEQTDSINTESTDRKTTHSKRQLRHIQK